MDGRLQLVLLLLLAASGLRGQGLGPGGPEEEAPEEEEVPEEDGILVLSQRTLGLALRKHRTLLVQFCECTRPVGWGTHQGCPGCSAPHPVDPQEASSVSPQPPQCSWSSTEGHGKQGQGLGWGEGVQLERGRVGLGGGAGAGRPLDHGPAADSLPGPESIQALLAFW